MQPAVEGQNVGSYTIELGDLGGLLKMVRDVLNECGIPFWIAWGTCLGAVRDGGLIPWDRGGDLGSFANPNREQSLAIAEAFRDKPVIVSFWELPESPVDDCWCSLTVAALMQITVRFKLENPKKWIGKFEAITDAVSVSFYRVSGPEVRMENVNGVTAFPTALFADLKPITLLGKEFYIPNPPEEYLRLCYGRDWRVPKEHGWEDDWKVRP